MYAVATLHLHISFDTTIAKLEWAKLGAYSLILWWAIIGGLLMTYLYSVAGLAYLPGTIAIGALSYSAAARAVNRFGIKPMIVLGMVLMAVGLLLFARAPLGGSFLVDVLPGMLVLGVGAAFAFMAVILASTVSVPESEAGLASGLVNTSQQVGGALGLAILASLAASYTGSVADTQDPVAALNSGYHVAFLASAFCLIVGAVLAATLLHLPKDKTSQRDRT